ncbi:MAG: acyl-CoA dehydrogenase C-terminal domain-containing protein [Pseudomonadota bacterium]
MPDYQPPIDDMRFLLRAFDDFERVRACPKYAEVDPDLVDAVIDEAGRFAQQELRPINLSGDAEGCAFDAGTVRTPTGFREAYQQFVEQGWGTLTCDADHGGQGLPHIVGQLVHEMFCSANMAISMYPGLTEGAYAAINAHASDVLKETYLPRLASGEWTGTMCLTEPHCGTDLGLLRTKAEPQGDGSYRISGSKIFISAGEHDLADNIIHLVLARLPDAPPGVRGISLFIVPKFSLDQAGEPGERNGVTCSSIEHKMGIKASATCALTFDDAVGFLVGTPHRGMNAMFTMMNAARLGVGVQGLAMADAAYQGAVVYAKDRLQGRSLKEPSYPDQAADPIIVHPDVRRMLLTMRALVEGGRALVSWVSAELDLSHAHPDADERRRADDFVQLMTPVVKAFLTDTGTDCANIGIQVYGGHGYVHDHGMEQFARDARIAQIYEGTNGVQALDLVGRKLSAHTGRYLRPFFHTVSEYIEANEGREDMSEFVGPLAKVFGRLQRATAHIAERGINDPDEAAAAATDYLRLFGYCALAFVWTRMAEVALDRAGKGESTFSQAFLTAKLRTARFYMQRLLPNSSGHFSALLSGAAVMMDFEEEAF